MPSYYPITAYEAQSGQVLRVQNRPGDIHDGKAALPFLRALLHQVRATLGRGYALEFRMDGAFFRRDVLGLLARWTPRRSWHFGPGEMRTGDRGEARE